jgi:hypothetical protein
MRLAPVLVLLFGCAEVTGDPALPDGDSAGDPSGNPAADVDRTGLVARDVFVTAPGTGNFYDIDGFALSDDSTWGFGTIAEWTCRLDIGAGETTYDHDLDDDDHEVVVDADATDGLAINRDELLRLSPSDDGFALASIDAPGVVDAALLGDTVVAVRQLADDCVVEWYTDGALVAGTRAGAVCSPDRGITVDPATGDVLAVVDGEARWIGADVVGIIGAERVARVGDAVFASSGTGVSAADGAWSRDFGVPVRGMVAVAGRDQLAVWAAEPGEEGTLSLIDAATGDVVDTAWTNFGARRLVASHGDAAVAVGYTVSIAVFDVR